MARFVVQRIISVIVALFILVTATYFLMHMVPGGPFNMENINPKAAENLKAKYGLDRPVYEQYAEYLGDLLHGDLGISIKKIGFTVNELIAEKFPVSAKLGVVAITFAACVGVPLGILAAMKRNKIADRIIMLICTLGVSMPSFVIATTLLYFLGIKLSLLPTMRLESWASYIMPALSLSFSPLSYITRLTRSNMLDVIDQDYIKTARAKGLSNLKVVGKHALRNSIIPVITYLGTMSAGILVGGFVVETVFSIPGLGSYFVGSISNRDYPMIMGTTIFYGVLIVVINMFVDIIYRFVDPRIKL